MKNALTHDDWMSALTDLGLEAVSYDPLAKTAKELAELWSCSSTTAKRNADKLVILGKAKRVTVALGRSRSAAYILTRSSK